MTLFIGADNKDFKEKLQQVKSALRRGFGSDALSLSKSIAVGMSGAAAAIGAVGLASIKMAADMEQNRIAFTTMLGSAQAADKMLSDLATFAEKTPFEFTGLVDSTKKLLAYGYTAQEIIPMMTSIGDAVAAVGGSAEVLDRVTLAFGQMKAKGFISGEEMRQLAEAGVPAWQMLANVIGKTIPETMKLAEDKALNANAAIAGMLAQMTQKYGGMMEKQSGTITGILSNIKDKGGALMRALGDEIVEALDLKTKMQGALTFLDGFAARVKESGVRAAIAEMIPPGLETTLYAIAGAITGVVVPALVLLAATASIAGVALWPFAAAGAAIFVVAKTMVDLSDASSTASQRLRDMAGSMSDIQTEAYNAAAAVTALNQEISKNYKNWEKGVQEHRRPGEGSFLDTGVPEPGPIITGGSGAKGKDLVAEAKRVSEAIEREWAQTTKTEMDQLGLWREQQLAALSETAVANENYQRDLERVEATYSVRRRKIMAAEENVRISIWDRAADAYRALSTKLGGIGLTGVSKQKYELETEAADQITTIERRYRDWAIEYANTTEEQKQLFRKAWEENGIQFSLTEKGMVDFSKQTAAERLVIETDLNQKLKDLSYARVKYQEELEQARKDGDVGKFTAMLEKEQGLLQRDLEGRQQYIDAYYDVWKDAHRSSMSYMAEGLGVLYQGTKDLFSGILDGTKSIGEAFADLGKKVLKMINDWVSEWLASQLMLSLFPKSSGASGASGATSGWLGAMPMLGFASGGNYPGGYAVVGENGPEIINFNRGGYVYDAGETRELVSGSLNQISVPVSINGDSNPKLAGRLRVEITELVQRILYEEARA